jgi:arginyl-tRNA synthetase
MNVLQHLQQKLRAALAGLFPGGAAPDLGPYVAMLKPAQDARFGDYQANCAMSLAKALGGKKPPEVARAIVGRLDPGDMLEPPEVAGPGFINLRLKPEWVAARVRDMARDDRLGVEPARPPRTVVIDYSSPNVAKPMHVGHLRSTIIGDALARLFRFLGHTVITDNHLGDWGTQFGMLLYGYKHFRDEAALQADPVREMVRLYVMVRKLIDPIEKVEEYEGARKKAEKAKAKKGKELVEPRYTQEELARACEVREAARQETAILHAGDPENVRLWQQFMPWSMGEIDQVYRRLDVKFDHTHGESFYNPMLPGVVQDLLARGIAQESRGAVVIPQLAGEPEEDAEAAEKADDPPAMIRKSDGAFTYTTTDLATLRYRMEQWNPDAILYIVGAPQALHFQNLFAAARRWGYDRVKLEHVPFGSVLGPDRKPLKTREGGTPGLEELLDGAVRRAAEVYQEICRQARERGDEVPEFTPQELRNLHEVIGIGAVKYADLSQNRASDYVYDEDKMMAMDGNTATYMQYAFVRNRGIFRKGEVDPKPLREQPPAVLLERPEERALAVQLLRFSEALDAAAADYRPSLITGYLWDLAKTYSGFFQNCPVLKAETPALRQSRLLLCDLTARVIQRGLDLLGIRTVERM